MTAGVDVTVDGVEGVGGTAEGCGKFSSTAAVGVVTDFIVVVAAGVRLAVFDNVVARAVIVVTETDVGTAVTVMAEDDTEDSLVGVVVSSVAAVVVLEGTDPIVFVVEGAVRFGSTGTLEAVETPGDGLISGRVVEAVLVGAIGAVVVRVGTEAAMESVTECAQEARDDVVSGSVTPAGAEFTTWTEADEETATGRGEVTCSAGAVGAWTVTEIGVEA